MKQFWLLISIQGRTGFPWIDAIVRQLHAEGWIHHVARQAIGCFLTRGCLWISWEEGFKVRVLVIQACWRHITGKCCFLAFNVLSSCCPLKKVLSNVCIDFFSLILRQSRSFVALFTHSLQSKVTNELDRLRIRLWFLWCGHHFVTCKSLGSSPVKMSQAFHDPLDRKSVV